MYRGPLNGLLVMMKTDGLRAVQAGLAPAMMYQFVMNGLRLGSYAMLEAGGFVRDSDGQLSLARCAVCSSASGGYYWGTVANQIIEKSSLKNSTANQE